MSRLALSGSHVVFVENMGGVRTVRLRDAGRMARRLGHISSRRSRRAPVTPSALDLVAPLLLPFPRSRLARRVNEVLIRRLARSIRQRSGADPIIFSFLPSREALELIARVRGPASVVVYYCVADFAELAQDRHAILTTEGALVRSADLVFANSTRFTERFGPLNRRVFYFPGGVSLAHFDPNSVKEIPVEIRGLARPLIGYVGGLHHHLDIELLGKLAASMPEASIVVIGPELTDIGDLGAFANVRLLGPRAWMDLPPLLASIDVGLIPYIHSAYTATVYPTKLFEYLAMGKPVVSTDLPEVRRLELPEFAVRVASDHQGFIEAVRAALSEADESGPQRRRELAEQRDWGAIVAEMAGLIAEAVEEKAKRSPSPPSHSSY
jgi:glycosyltransferase involved in cell wall biosynthesis